MEQPFTVLHLALGWDPALWRSPCHFSISHAVADGHDVSRAVVLLYFCGPRAAVLAAPEWASLGAYVCLCACHRFVLAGTRPNDLFGCSAIM